MSTLLPSVPRMGNICMLAGLQLPQYQPTWSVVGDDGRAAGSMPSFGLWARNKLLERVAFFISSSDVKITVQVVTAREENVSGVKKALACLVAHALLATDATMVCIHMYVY